MHANKYRRWLYYYLMLSCVGLFHTSWIFSKLTLILLAKIEENLEIVERILFLKRTKFWWSSKEGK